MIRECQPAVNTDKTIDSRMADVYCQMIIHQDLKILGK